MAERFKMPAHSVAEGDQLQAEAKEVLDDLIKRMRARGETQIPFPVDVVDLHDSFAGEDTSEGVYLLCEMLALAIRQLGAGDA